MIKWLQEQFEDSINLIWYLWYLVRKTVYDRELAPYFGPIISLSILIISGVISIKLIYSLLNYLLGDYIAFIADEVLIFINHLPFKSYTTIALIVLYFILFEKHLLRYPRANKKKITIGIAFNFSFIKRRNLAEILSHAKDIKEELYKTIREEDLGSQYKIVIINDYLADKIYRNISNEKFRERFIEKTKLAFIIFGYVKRFSYSKKEQYKFEVDYMVTHRPIPIPKSNEMGNNFNRILKEQMWNYDVDDSGNLITQIANNIRLNVFYALGVVAGLYPAGYQVSNRLLSKLLEEIKNGKNSSSLFIRSIKYNLSASYYGQAIYVYENRDNDNYIKDSVRNLELSIKYRPTYNAYLLIGYFHFLLSNINDAFKSISEAKKYSTDISWKFSEAFLHFYNGNLESIKKGLEVYNSISSKSIKKIAPQTFEFILATIDDELNQSRHQFYYSKIFVLSKCLKDYKQTETVFKQFNETIKPGNKYRYLVEEVKKKLLKVN